MSSLRLLLRSALLACLAASVGVTSAQPAQQGGRVILVAGATGTQGGAVARALVERGYTVRGLTRNPTSGAARALTALGVVMVKGDFDDAGSLAAALEGAYGAFSVQQYRGVGVAAEIRQGKAFADAARRAGVRHFVYTSVAKAPLATGVPQFDSKLEIEAYVRASGLPYTIIRPASFMIWLDDIREQALTGVISGPLPGDQARSYIAPRDIGHFVADAFDDPEHWIGRELDVAGDTISYAGVAALLSRILERPVVYQQIPWEEYVRSATPTAIERDRWYIDHDVPMDTDALRREYPWLQTTEQYLRAKNW
jgi:uncharacterized protein YbjT (DUF2867 family)